MPVQATDINVENGPALVIDSSEGPWIINTAVSVRARLSGDAIDGTGSSVVLFNFGYILTSDGAGWAIFLPGANNSITNEQDAFIWGSSLAVRMGAGSSLINYGKVRGLVSIEPSGGDAASAETIGLAADAPSGLFLLNTGTMIGGMRSQGIATDEVHNAGSIFGDVILGGGADLYDGRGGLLHGVVKGKGGADTILGGDHDETLEGGGGNDLIRGGRGDDEINGGAGKDTVSGGRGDDNFIFANRGKADRVVDFSPGEDSLFLDSTVWKGLGGKGGLKSSAFNLGSEATDADDRILYDAETGVLRHDANGNKAGGVATIARLDPNLGLGHQDFEIV